MIAVSLVYQRPELRWMRDAAALILLALATLALAGCGGSTPVVGEDYSELDIDRIALLPMHDLRSDNALRLDIPDDISVQMEEILQYKGYVTERPGATDYLELNGLSGFGITREQLEQARPEWIRSIEPIYANWVLLPVVSVGYHTEDPQASTSIGVEAYLFDTQSGKVVWRNSLEQSYLDEKGNRARAEQTVRNTARDLLKTMPLRPQAASEPPVLQPSVYKVAVAEIVPIPIPGADNNTVIRVLHESIRDNGRVELEYSPYRAGEQLIADLPPVEWTIASVSRPLEEAAVAIGRRTNADGVLLFSMTLSGSVFRGDVYIVDVAHRRWLHRKADFSSISILQRVPHMEHTAALLIEDFVNSSDRLAGAE